MDDSEEIVFSSQICIGKGWFFKKFRKFVLTNKYVYVIKNTRILRRIGFRGMVGITFSLINQDEMILHIDDQPDIRFTDPKKSDVIEAI